MTTMKVRVVTYNIAGNHDDFHARFRGIVMTLASSDADIICLQEVSGTALHDTQAHTIAAALGIGCVHFSPVPNWTVENAVYGNAVIFRVPLSAHSPDTILLGRGSLVQDNGQRMPGATEERVAAVVSCTVSASHRLVVVSAHVGIFNTTDRASGSSLRPADCINTYVEGLLRGTGKGEAVTVLVCGDFNAEYTSPLIVAMRGYGFDAGEAFFEGKLSRYLHTARPPPLHERPKIDYVFQKSSDPHVVKMLPQLTIASPASDHNPVLATVVLSLP